MITYDTFAIADTVSAKDGGSFAGAVSMASTLGVTGAVTASSTASIAGHASVGVAAVDSTRALTVAGATDGTGSSIIVGYNSSLASKFSVRDDGFVSVGNGLSLADGNLTVASGHGVDFSAASNAGGMSNELLDDYEEGTWTAAFTGTSSTSTGNYTKVGNTVFITVYGNSLNVTSTPTATISGLPFTNNGGYTAASITHDTYSNNSYNGYFASGATSIIPIQDNAVGGAPAVVRNPAYIMVSGTYITNS